MTLLCRLAAEGKTAEDIAGTLGRTVTAIRIKAAQERVNVTLSGRQRPPATQPSTSLRSRQPAE